MTDKPNPSTDPRWRPEDGGLPEPDRGEWIGWRSDTCAAGEPGISTITPPFAEPLSPFVRSRIDTALRLLEEAVAEMKRTRDGQP